MLGLINSSGTEVVGYNYNAWGETLSVTGTLASTLGNIQPFRYRGYIYDYETGLYYLRSRYYNPVWCRFINADSLINNNLFCYCNNNVVDLNDSNGNEPMVINKDSENQNLVAKEFFDLYTKSYNEPYLMYNDYTTLSIEKYDVTITKSDMHIINVTMTLLTTIISLLPIGHSAIPATLVGLANGYAAVEDPNYQVGTHTHYRVIQTREHWEGVEVGNFHGYKTYERKKFIGTKIDEFILIDDKLHKDRTHETDTHLLYTYRNRIYGK